MTLMRLRMKLMIAGGGGGDDDNKGEGEFDNKYSEDATCFFGGERASIHALTMMMMITRIAKTIMMCQY